MKKIILITLMFCLNGLFGLGVNATMPGMAGDIQRSYANTEFGRVHYWEIGQGSVLFMFHQSGQTSTEFLAVAPLLADTYKVVAIDLPNHGQSDTSDHELTIDEYADAVIDVMDSMGINQAHMLGQHGGAAVAINLGLRYSERVEKVILSGAGRDEEITEEKLEELLNTPMTRDLPIDLEGEFLQKTWSVYRKMSASNTPPEVVSCLCDKCNMTCIMLSIVIHQILMNLIKKHCCWRQKKIFTLEMWLDCSKESKAAYTKQYLIVEVGSFLNNQNCMHR